MQLACFAKKLVSLNHSVRVSILILLVSTVLFIYLPPTLPPKRVNAKNPKLHAHRVDIGYPSDPNRQNILRYLIHF